MKKILLFLITLLPALAISQVEYDTVTVIDPEDFLLVSEVDTSQIQFFSKKAGTWRRVNPQTVKDWIKPDSLVFDADTLYLYSGGSATPLKVFLPDLNGIYSGNGTVPSGTYVEQLGPLRFDIDSFGSFAVGDFDELTTGALFSISNYAGNNGKVTIRSGSGAGFTDATVEVNGYDLPRKSATAEGLAPGQYVWIVDQGGNFVGEDSTGWINKDDVGRNGLFDASNDADTIRVSTALLRAGLNITGGAYGMNITSSSIPFASTSTGNISGWFTSQNSGTAAYMNVVDVVRLTTGTAAAGLGGRIRYVLEADNGSSSIAGYLGVKWNSAAAASRSSDFQVRLLGGGTEYDRLTLSGATGQLTLPGYAASALNSVDSSLYVLASDATGDVWSIPVDSLGGGGGGVQYNDSTSVFVTPTQLADSNFVRAYPLNSIVVTISDTIDFQGRISGTYSLDFSEVDTSSLVFLNAPSSVVPTYTLHLKNVSTDVVRWPANLKDAGGNTYGRRAITSAELFAVYYDGVNYYTNAALGVDTTITPFVDTIESVGSLLFYIHADSISGISSGDSISTWPDLSANNIPFAQSNPSRKPTYLQSVQNGKSAVAFDGIDDYMFTDSISFTSDSFTVATVIRLDTVAPITSQFIFAKFDGASDPNKQFFGHIMSDSTWRFVVGDGANSCAYKTTAKATQDSVYVLIVRGDGTNNAIKVSVNSTEYTLTGTPSATAINDSNFPIYLGSRDSVEPATPPATYSKITVFMQAIYLKYISDVEKNNLNTYLNNQYSAY